MEVKLLEWKVCQFPQGISKQIFYWKLAQIMPRAFQKGSLLKNYVVQWWYKYTYTTMSKLNIGSVCWYRWYVIISIPAEPSHIQCQEECVGSSQDFQCQVQNKIEDYQSHKFDLGNHWPMTNWQACQMVYTPLELFNYISMSIKTY